MEKRKLRRGTRDKEEKGREGERCPQDLSSSFTLRHCPPRGSLRSAKSQRDSSSASLELESFPPPRSFVLPAHESDNALLASKLRYHLPFPPGWIFPIFLSFSSFQYFDRDRFFFFFSSTCNSCCNSMRQQKMRDNLNDFERK